MSAREQRDRRDLLALRRHREESALVAFARAVGSRRRARAVYDRLREELAAHPFKRAPKVGERVHADRMALIALEESDIESQRDEAAVAVARSQDTVRAAQAELAARVRERIGIERLIADDEADGRDRAERAEARERDDIVALRRRAPR